MSRPWIGQPVRRREDARFLRGEGRYVADIVRPGMLHMVLVRSPLAHAILRHVHASGARSAPGVVAVVTGAELTGRLRPFRIVGRAGAEMAQTPHPFLASSRVRYVGEAVAAIVAETSSQAEDAAGRLEVQYEPLPAVTRPADALRGGVVLHEGLPSNVLMRWAGRSGDTDGALATAARTIRGTFHIPRLVAAPIEPRGAVAEYDRGRDLLTVWCSSQDPWRPLDQLSHALGRSSDRIRFVVPDVGGAFGSKGGLPPEVVLASLLAIDLERPIRWIEGRRENFMAAYQGRGMDAEIEMALDAGGRVSALRARLLVDLGAYFYTRTSGISVNTAMLLTGPYAIPATSVEVIGVATNKPPVGPYRGAGRPEAAYLIERMMDLAAADLNEDPVAFRRRHLIPGDRFPYRTPLGFVYDSGDYARALDRCRDLLEYDRWRSEQASARAQGRLLGVGIACYVEHAGTGEWEAASVSVSPSGRVTVRTGSSSHGQGHETVFAQIAADALGVGLDAIAVGYGDSAAGPRGVGTYGSRSVSVGGSALVRALGKIRSKATAIAAHLLEASPTDIEWADGRLFVRGAPERSLAFAEVAAAAYQPRRLPAHIEMGLDAVGYFALPGPVFPFGAHGAVVEISAQTGEVTIHRVVAVDDGGRIINPLLAEGQVVGGSIQGLGQAFLEETVYDADGQLLTGTFTDYGILRASQAPRVETAFQETLSPYTPLGTKGVGEAGAIGAPAAAASAVMDALAHLGIRHIDFPFSAAKLWQIIRAHGHCPR